MTSPQKSSRYSAPNKFRSKMTPSPINVSKTNKLRPPENQLLAKRGRPFFLENGPSIFWVLGCLKITGLHLPDLEPNQHFQAKTDRFQLRETLSTTWLANLCISSPTSMATVRFFPGGPFCIIAFLAGENPSESSDLHKPSFFSLIKPSKNSENSGDFFQHKDLD